MLADVRSYPSSEKNPQFNRDSLERELVKQSVRYFWLQKLGGRRRGLGRESRNICWKNLSFRNYADYMETASFSEGIDELMQLSRSGLVAVMCAEAVYWRCHRSMISDFLKSKGVHVVHLFNDRNSREHEYTQCARIRDGQLTYRD